MVLLYHTFEPSGKKLPLTLSYTMYKTPFFLTEPVGNNAFSYDQRVSKQLYIPALVTGTCRDLKLGNRVVFEEEDEHGVLRSCYGLENFVRMEWKGIPLVVFDNHNHALYFWYEAQRQGILGAQNTLVHIDEHSDLWENAYDILETDLISVHHFTNYRCNVGNYIQPALRQGIIEKVLCIEDFIGMGKYGSYTR